MTAQFTMIGHSNRNLDELLTMLRNAGIGLVVDVRRFPRSRSNPEFNIDRLPQHLARLQIGYKHCPALGGRRSKQPAVDSKINAMWHVGSFHNYADYALSAEFGAAFDELLELGQHQRLTLMCSESVWWRCHRRIITDHLLLNDHAVDHLMGPGQTERATPTPGAQKNEHGQVIYPGD
ncbi:DUF488 family protein [Manganibacter manganicus]|uniref:DNA repair protein n=1 Tax=Manganibacter manganicus TaxID=1873176 RepID=A0A1V8RP96_9HYPH|nr:DUF488 domain-containing protein [Pseudaminobacter manganicus]OQM74988.1 DNA repair protein [Pseudaminobacter manganicus]